MSKQDASLAISRLLQLKDYGGEKDFYQIYGSYWVAEYVADITICGQIYINQLSEKPRRDESVKKYSKIE